MLLGLSYRKCKLVSKTEVTHDTKLFCFMLPKSTHLQVPIGQHVYLKQIIAGRKNWEYDHSYFNISLYFEPLLFADNLLYSLFLFFQLPFVFSLGTEVVKPYTPLLPFLPLDFKEPFCQDGVHIYLMIKIYSCGLFTQALDHLQIGKYLLWGVLCLVLSLGWLYYCTYVSCIKQLITCI